MRDAIAISVFVLGAALLSWAAWKTLDRRRWLRRSAAAAALVARAGGAQAETLDVRAVLKRRDDKRIYRGRAALFLARDLLWIELDHKGGGASVELSSVIRTALVPVFEGAKPAAGKHLLYIGWRQEPDGVVEAAFDLPNAGFWKRDLDAMLGHGVE